MSKPKKKSSAKSAPASVWPLAAVTFLSGAITMSLEMIGSRIIAPTLGNSIYTWSALIGVVLIGLSLGGLIGGLIIDKRTEGKVLIKFLGVCGIVTAFIPMLVAGLGDAFLKTQGSPLISGLLLSGLLFLAPSLALGAITPLSIRLASSIAGADKVGFVAGLVGMAGSLGSFVGVIATPFLLVPHFSLSHSIYGLAIATVLAGLLVGLALPDQRKAITGLVLKFLGIVIAIVAFLGLSSCGSDGPVDNGDDVVLFQENTPYHRVTVLEQLASRGGTRHLKLDSTSEGGITPGQQALPLPYQNSWALVKSRPAGGVRRALCIGAGAFGIPQRICDQYPEAIVEVSEIDPVVVEVGERFFGVDRYPNILSKATDGRLFLHQSDPDQPFDFVFLDAYNGIGYIPPHLATQEFFDLLRSRMTDDGLVLANVISPVDGKGSRILWSFVRTMESVFPEVRVYPTPGASYGLSQNVIIACSMSEANYLPPTPSIAENLKADFGVLVTDERNPMEFFVATK